MTSYLPMFSLTGLWNFTESTIDYVYKKKENKEMIIKKEKKEKKSVAMVEVRSCGVNPDIDPRKHPELLGTHFTGDN